MAFFTIGTNVGNLTLSAENGKPVKVAVNKPLIPFAAPELPIDDLPQDDSLTDGEREQFMRKLRGNPGNVGAVCRELQKSPDGTTISYHELSERLDSTPARPAAKKQLPEKK